MLCNAKIVADLIAASIAMLKNAISLQVSPDLTVTQKVMFRNSDTMLPLHEQAIGRMYMNAGLDHDFVHTQEGLFSMMIFHFITFNSQAFIFRLQHLQKIRDSTSSRSSFLIYFLQEQFRSLDDWNQHIVALKRHFEDKPSLFFCDTKHRKGCNTANADKFYEFAKQCQWPLSNELPVTFEYVWSWIKDVKSYHNNLLPSMGTFWQYLLIADMCKVGLVSLPSFGDIGSIISKVNSDTIASLQDLRYLPPSLLASQATISESTLAFTQFYRDVEENLTNANRIALDWNTIVAEHTLCTFKRLNKAGYYMGR